MISTRQQVPTNEEIRQMAIDSVPLFVGRGQKADYLNAVMEQFLKIQFHYFPAFCEDTRDANMRRKKELDAYGYKTSTKMIGGKVYEGTTGWSKDGNFKEKWIISNQLRYFMMNIDKNFWDDKNSKVRNSFMRNVIKGENAYILLDKVYSHYGKNINKISEQAIIV